MADVVKGSGGPPIVQEVETEFEDDGEEEEQLEHPEEVEEEEGSEATEAPESAAEYVVPEQNKEVWKNFGYNTEAGRALRKLYSGIKQADAASKVSYPRLISPARKWEPAAPVQKPCPQRARVAVPRAKRATIDRDDPRYWYVPAPGRKPEAEIRAEMEAQRPEKPNLIEGRDQVKEKRGLQQKFRYGGGNAMPPGAMGNVSKGEIPEGVPLRRPEDRWDHIDDSGMTREQKSMFEQITEEIKDKQARLAVLDAQDAANPKPSKEKTSRNRESLQLHNDIQRCLGDIDKLLQLSDA